MNKNIWELYKNSERGRNAIELFTFHDGENEADWAEKIFSKYSEYFGGEQFGSNSSKKIVDCCVDNFYFSLLSILALELSEEGEYTTDYFERLIDNIEIAEVQQDEEGKFFKSEDGFVIVNQQDYKTLCAIMPEISLALYFLYSNAFVPVLFREQFDVFMKMLDVLDIPIPELPAKSDKRGRLMFYNDLNNEIAEFAEKHNLTVEEICACIYDYSFMLMEENQNEPEMPEPTNIWLTGGSRSDYKTFLENPVKGAKSIWTCNENTKRGDIIIMYVLAPYSCIQSIWRADIDGFYTPFNYYNSRTRTTDGILVPHITLNELKTDPYFSQIGITRKNFQGVNGVQFSAKDYKELQRLLKDKGFDISVLPQLYRPDLEIEGVLKNEKDVEEQLLIPLLSKLGFAETDWTRQLSQKAGRNEKAIPDFVFLPKGEIHFQNAPMIIEAKYDMSSNIERTKSYNQALSYARMMKSNIFGTCDKDRLIIYKENKGFFDRFKPTFEKHWQNINDEEVFRQLKLLIGKETISK